jgi:hypothetical protein
MADVKNILLSSPAPVVQGVPGLPSIIDLAVEYWFLELHWNLEVGFWSFALRAPENRDARPQTQDFAATLRNPMQTNARSSPGDFFSAQPFHWRCGRAALLSSILDRRLGRTSSTSPKIHESQNESGFPSPIGRWCRSSAAVA